MAVADDNAGERERGRAARVLHDIVVHHVCEIRAHASTLATAGGGASVAAIVLASDRALQELRRMADVIDPAHTVSYAPPPDLAALRDLLDAERPRHRVDVRPSPAVPAGVAAVCFGVAQEVLRAMHATLGARLDGARLRVADGRVQLRLDVAGGGALDIGPAVLRARLIGGTVTADANRVRVEFPL